MSEIRNTLEQKLYNFYNFLFWGFYFSAGYLFCKNKGISNGFIYSNSLSLIYSY